MKRWLVTLALVVFSASAANAQIIPRPGGIRPPSPQQQRRDTTKDSTKVVRFAPADSVAQRLLQNKAYTVTRYEGDTAFFNAQSKTLDLLAAKKRPAIVERDSNTVVSDSGIYYRENRPAITGGHYVLTPPASSGQAQITGHGRVDYNFNQRSVRITNARLPVNNGEIWYMDVKVAQVVQDTANGKTTGTVYSGGGSITSCDDTIPDYHFEYGQAKRTAGNTIVAAPAVLYIRDVPVMWLPFMFADNQGGRHSGILPPQFGLGDIIRNSPSYRRHVDHLGYYWATSDYTDFATWLDWRSAAGSSTIDPGWLKLNTDFNYKWLDRFMTGRIGASYTTQNDGSTNTAISWSHQEDLTRNQHITMDMNYVTNTTLQRQNTFNPYTALATISSQANYQAKMGPASITIGATRKQYPGRPQVDQTFPTVSFTTSPIGISDKFSWTPGFSFSRSDVLHMDQPGIGQYTYSTNPNGLRDSSLSTFRNSSNSSISFDTPITIFGWDLKNSIHVNQQRNNFPQQFTIYDVESGAITDTRIFAATYQTTVDWNPEFSLPPIGHNRLNLTPTFSVQNVDPGPFWVASERTNGQFVSQSKRPQFGVSMSPTLYGLFPGFGPFSRLRHSITPSIQYAYAPKADVSDEYLQALGRTRKDYVGNTAQNQITFGLTQNIEAKRTKPSKDPKDSTASDNVEHIKLLGLTFQSVAYDFERAKKVGRALNGVTTDGWGYTVNSDLLPGFDFSTNYSLFQGSTLSDTARFKPYLTGVQANLSLSREQNPFVLLARLFGKAVPQAQASPNPANDQVRQRPDSAESQALAAQPVAGSARAGDRFIIPPVEGWKATLGFSRSSPRPPFAPQGSPNVIQFDPTARCEAIVGSDPFLLQQCLANQRAQPTTDTPVGSLTAGGPVYAIPPTTSINGDLSFNLTPKWAAHWTTTYDVEHHQFASHIVQLQRELHDWRAIFGFTQSPNGNFAFNFTIALKAEPDLKFDYNRATVRSGAVPF
ncbi:MAG TPA: putative LPS assembly protein LptD [Gemmatimonadaceae bacterium]